MCIYVCIYIILYFKMDGSSRKLPNNNNKSKLNWIVKKVKRGKMNNQRGIVMFMIWGWKKERRPSLSPPLQGRLPNACVSVNVITSLVSSPPLSFFLSHTPCLEIKALLSRRAEGREGVGGAWGAKRVIIENPNYIIERERKWVKGRKDWWFENWVFNGSLSLSSPPVHLHAKQLSFVLAS